MDMDQDTRESTCSISSDDQREAARTSDAASSSEHLCSLKDEAGGGGSACGIRTTAGGVDVPRLWQTVTDS